MIVWKATVGYCSRRWFFRCQTAQAGRKPSLVDNAYVALKEVIRDGVLPPGYQGSEQEIAGKLNMSRTPVHEAIIRLQSEGLVKVLPKLNRVILARNELVASPGA